MLLKSVKVLRIAISFLGAAVAFIVAFVLMYIASVPHMLACIISGLYAAGVWIAGWIITSPRPTTELDDDSEN